MKILVAPGTVQITSKLGRSTRQPTKTNRPPCFAEIWIDCTDDSIYLHFSDTSIYRYDPNSIDTARELVIALNHGETFNKIYRLFGISGETGAYEKVAFIPFTATLIYSNPPYAGADPGPTPCSPALSFTWTNFVTTPPPTSAVFTPASGSTGDTGTSTIVGPPLAVGLTAGNHGQANYTGPGGPFTASGIITISGATTADQLVQVFLTQDTTIVAFAQLATNGTTPYTIPVTLLPGVGADTDVHIDLATAVGPTGATSLNLAASMTVT